MRVIPPIEILPATFTRASTGTFTDADGVLQTAAVDVPRFDYGYAPEPEGGALVNLLPYSENFAAWLQSFVSVLPSAIPSPYAGKTAAKLVEAVGAGTKYIYISVLGSAAVVVGQQVTQWWVVKPAERYRFEMRLFNVGAFPIGLIGYYNTATGAATASGGATAMMEALADGFWLLTMTATATATGVAQAGFVLADASGSIGYTGDGVSGAYIARAQINYGPVPQAYIETNGEAGYTPPAWVFKGLLQETAATNLCLRSQELNTAPWSGNVSASVSAKTWHGVPFYTLTKTVTTNSENRAQNLGPQAAGASLTVTLALLAGTYNALQFSFYGSVSGEGVGNTSALILEGPGIAYPPVSGILTVGGLSTVYPTLVRLTRTFTVAETVGLYLYPGTAGSTTIGHSILATRVQVVAGLTDGGSYIPTTSATVTRAADVMGTGMVSSIPEPDSYTSELAWLAATNYTTGQRVARATTHRVYERLAPGGVDASLPESSPTEWLDLQPDNKFAMFDLTDNTASVASGPIHFAIKSGLRCNSLFLGGVVGTDVQTVVTADGAEDYSNQQNLRLRKTTGWYSYFFGGFAYRKAVALLDLPPLTTATVSVSITNTGAGGTACAAAVLGKNVFIGLAEYNAQRKARNFSTVTRDEFGKATLVKRRSIPTTQQTLFIKKELADTILEMNELLNATPAAWLGLDEPEDGYFNALQIVGVYQEFDVDVSYPNHARVNLKLEEI